MVMIKATRTVAFALSLGSLSACTEAPPTLQEWEDSIVQHCMTNLQPQFERCFELISRLENDETFRSREHKMLLADAYEGLRVFSPTSGEKDMAKKRQLEIYDDLVESNPDDTQSLLYMALLQDTMEAENRFYLRALDIDPTYVPALLRLGSNLTNEDDADSVELGLEYLKRAYRHYGRNPIAGAVDYYQALVAFDRNDLAQDFLKEVLEDNGISDLQKEMREAPEKQLVSVARKNIPQVCQPSLLRLDHSETCVASLSLTTSKELPRDVRISLIPIAIDGYSKLVTYQRHQPKDPSDHVILIELLTEWLSLNPADQDRWFQYSTLVSGEEKFRALQKATKIVTNAQPAAFLALSQHYFSVSDFNKAESNMRQAFDSSPEDEKASYGFDLANLLSSLGKEKEANELREELGLVKK